MSNKTSKEESSNVLSLLNHPLRVDILKLVYAEPRSFTDLLKHLSLESSSKLSFHLDKLSSLVEKNDRGSYDLTDKGLRAYSLLVAFEKDELAIPPKPARGQKRLLSTDKNPAVVLLLVQGLLVVFNYISSLVLALINPNLVFAALIIPFVTLAIFIFLCYKMGISYDLTSKGTYILLLLIVAIDYNIGSLFGTERVSSFFNPSVFYLGAFFAPQAPDPLSAMMWLFSWLIVTFMMLKTVQYLSEYFNWTWNEEMGDYEFRGPKYFEYLKKWQIIAAISVVYVSLVAIFWQTSVVLYDYYIPDSAFSFTRTMFIPPVYRLFTFFPILIATVLIYHFYRSSRLPSIVKHGIPVVIIAGESFITLGRSIIYYLTSPVMDLTREVPGNLLMPEMYLLSAIILAIVKIAAITGMTVFILAFLSKGLQLVDDQQLKQESVESG